MEYDQFISAVQQRARLASNGEAVRAVHATLETLGERLTEDQADKLAAQLPQEIGYYLRNAKRTERFELDEFFNRAARKSGADKPEAVYQVRAVMEVLREGVTPQLFEKVKAQLPDDFDPLFEAESQGEMDFD